MIVAGFVSTVANVAVANYLWQNRWRPTTGLILLSSRGIDSRLPPASVTCKEKGLPEIIQEGLFMYCERFRLFCAGEVTDNGGGCLLAITHGEDDRCSAADNVTTGKISCQACLSVFIGFHVAPAVQLQVRNRCCQ